MKKGLKLLSLLVSILTMSAAVSSYTLAYLFDSVETNIEVSSANIECECYLSNLRVFSSSTDEGDELTIGCSPDDPYYYFDTESNGFADGGYTIIDENILTLVAMNPGDMVRFDLHIENKSTITTQYNIDVHGEDGSFTSFDLLKQLSIFVDGESYLLLNNISTDYTNWDVNDEYVDIEITIALPLDASNENFISASIDFNIKCMQSNLVPCSNSVPAAVKEANSLLNRKKELYPSKVLNDLPIETREALLEVDNLIWNPETNLFGVYEEGTYKYGGTVIEDNTSTWVFKDTYSSDCPNPIYLTGNSTIPGLVINKSIDTGENNVSYINYTYDGLDDTEIIISTNCKDTYITVNAPNKVVHHYGEMAEVQLFGAFEYHENGTLALATLISGNFIIEAGARVYQAHFVQSGDVDSKYFDDIIIDVKAGASAPEYYSRNKIHFPTTLMPMFTLKQNGVSETLFISNELLNIENFRHFYVSPNGGVDKYDISTGSRDIQNAAYLMQNRIFYKYSPSPTEIGNSTILDLSIITDNGLEDTYQVIREQAKGGLEVSIKTDTWIPSDDTELGTISCSGMDYAFTKEGEDFEYLNNDTVLFNRRRNTLKVLKDSTGFGMFSFTATSDDDHKGAFVFDLAGHDIYFNSYTAFLVNAFYDFFLTDSYPTRVREGVICFDSTVVNDNPYSWVENGTTSEENFVEELTLYGGTIRNYGTSGGPFDTYGNLITTGAHSEITLDGGNTVNNYSEKCAVIQLDTDMTGGRLIMNENFKSVACTGKPGFGQIYGSSYVEINGSEFLYCCGYNPVMSGLFSLRGESIFNFNSGRVYRCFSDELAKMLCYDEIINPTKPGVMIYAMGMTNVININGGIFENIKGQSILYSTSGSASYGSIFNLNGGVFKNCVSSYSAVQVTDGATVNFKGTEFRNIKVLYSGGLITCNASNVSITDGLYTNIQGTCLFNLITKNISITGGSFINNKFSLGYMFKGTKSFVYGSTITNATFINNLNSSNELCSFTEDDSLLNAQLVTVSNIYSEDYL